MVKFFDNLKAKFESKKEEQLGETIEEPQIETVEATLEEPMPEGFVSLEDRARSAQPAPTMRATVVNLDKSTPTEQSLNLTKKEQPSPKPLVLNLDKNEVIEKQADLIVPQVVKNTGGYSQGGIKEQLESQTTTDAQVKDVPKPWVDKEIIAKGILFVTFTSIVADGIMYVYDSGTSAVLALIIISAIIQFALVTEYRKPTMR